MSVILDTTVVVALYDRADRDHERVARWARTLDDDLVTTPVALAEMDYVVERRGGQRARDVLWSDLDAGAYLVRWWADGLSASLEIARRQPLLGLADASLAALCGLLRTPRIATLDTHFRSIELPSEGPLVLLPDDA